MKIVTPFVELKLPGVLLAPNESYIMHDQMARIVVDALEAQRGSISVRCSDFANHYALYYGQDLNGKSLLIHRHGAWGDMLIITALTDYIQNRYPRADISLCCHPIHAGAFPETVSITGEYPTKAEVLAYDYFLPMENLFEEDQEPDQRNCYDVMFGRAGFQDVDNKWKRCSFRVDSTPAENYVLVQRESNFKIRTYQHTQELIDRLRELGVEVWVAEKNGLQTQDGPFIPTSGLLDLVPYIQSARIVIAPDSAISHLASAFPDVPCITLWGTHHPDDRQQYYTNHHAIQGDGCLIGPCKRNFTTIPTLLCKQASGYADGTEHCTALSNISVGRVVQKVFELLNR